MARLWTCGFELQSLTANVECTALTGTASISTSVHRSGAAALRANPAAASGYIEHQVDTAASAKRTFHRFYLRIATLPAATTAVYAIGQSGFFPCHVRLSNTGTLQLYDASTTTAVGNASAALSTGVWYRVEVDHQDGAAGTATATAYLDGVQFGTGAVTVVNGFSRIRAGVYTPTTTADIYIDDIAVNDATGSAQTGLPGPGNVYHLRPNAAGDNNGFATAVGGTAGAANNYTRVNEVTPNDATSYNQTTATGTTTIDDFNLDSSATAGIGTGERVTLVQVGGRIGSDAATAASLVYRIKSQAAGTVLESASVSVALNGWASHKAAAPFIHQLTSYTDPQAGGAWTQALLDTAQIGYRSNVSQTTSRRVSTLWALAETVPITTAALSTASETDTAQALTKKKTKALGVATETDTARTLNPVVGTGFAALTDNFNDNTVDTGKWPDSYGAISETGGRARVPCTIDYAAYASAATYRLRESHVHCRLFPAADGGATAEAWAQVLITTTTAGTDAIVEVNAATGNLVMAVRVGYFDPGQVAITYNATDHAWVRIRETGGQLLWDTSPDGTTWTNRYTATSPAWVGDTTLQLQLISHRDGGTDDYAEFDNLNTGAAQQAALTLASETDTGQALGRSKTQALARASATETAQGLARAKSRTLGTAGASEAAQPFARAKKKALTLASAVETAQALVGRKTKAVTAAGETSTAQALARSKRKALALAAETDAAQPLTRVKRLALGAATETSTGQAAGKRKAVALGQATETDTGLTLAPASGLQPAAETDTGMPLGRTKARALGLASATEEARPFGRAKTRTLGTAGETDTGTAPARVKNRPATLAAETDAAQSLTGAKTRALTPAVETGTASALGKAKTTPLGRAASVEEAQSLTSSQGAALVPSAEADTARPLSTAKTRLLIAAAETDTARSLAAGKRVLLGAAGSVCTAMPLGQSKRRPLGPAGTTETALQLGAARSLVLGVATEISTARIGPYVRITPAVETVQALALTGQRQRPADQLTPSTSVPTLTPGTSGPVLTASTSGPQLAATSTSGG